MSRQELVKQSAPERLADLLRESLLRLELYPGSQLREVELAERYGVSRHTIRSALAILSGEGVVVHDRHRGSRVREVAVSDIVDVFDLRAALELEAVRIVCDRKPELAGLTAAVAELERLERLERQNPSPNQTYAALTADRAVHRAIIEASGNERLARAYQTIDTEIAYYYALYITEMPLDDQEHRRMLEAIASFDGTTASELLSEHIREARDHCARAVRPVRGTASRDTGR